MDRLRKAALERARPDGPARREEGEAGERVAVRAAELPDAPAAGTTPACNEIGVIGALPGVVGAWQALEAVKLLAGIGVQFIINGLVLLLAASVDAISRRRAAATGR